MNHLTPEAKHPPHLTRLRAPRPSPDPDSANDRGPLPSLQGFPAPQKRDTNVTGSEQDRSGQVTIDSWQAQFTTFHTGSRALHVLFVCTGNICRSPTAERLAVAYANKSGFQGFSASSAGTRAVTGSPIHPEAALVLQHLGALPSNFVARQLTSKIAASADLVVTMTKAHRDAVLQLAPAQLRRTFTLLEAARLATECNAERIVDLAELRPQLATQDLTDIPDPIGQSAEVFGSVGSQIAELLPPIIHLCRRG